MEIISIHDFKTSKLKSYYGSSKKVYRKSHVERLLKMWSDLHCLAELHTRTRLVPCNDDFLQKKAIPHFNGIKLKADRLYKRFGDGGLILGCVSSLV